MEKEGILGHNPSGEFHWQSDPHVNHDGSITPAMEMNLDSGGNGGDRRRHHHHHHHLHHQLATNPTLVNLNNWEQSSTVDDVQTTNFESALSSLVSSPTSSSACNIPSESFAIRELIGRLGSICNGKSPPNDYHRHQSGTNDHAYSSSCYSTPLNSPPKLNLSMTQFAAGGVGVGMDFVADPGFAERAARFSCFGAARNFAEFVQEPGKLSRVSSTQSLKAAGGRGGQLDNDNNMMMMMRMNLMMGRSGGELGLNNNNNNVNICNAKEEPSPPERITTPCGSEGNPVVRKRKAPFSSSPSKGSRGKDASNLSKPSQEENSNSKRCKSVAAADGANGDGNDAVKEPRVEENGGTAEKQNGKDKESNARPPEHPKQDYIHVRARRGQATDSHSLAERVRREKISERMKFLQDLVPGCNKVTGKAVMLDEIINYVQSLQRQVEFLSMKLATVNPLVDGVLTKEMHQPRGPMLPPHSSYPLEATNGIGFSCANQPQGQGPPLRSLLASNALEAQLGASCLSRSLSMQLPSLDGFTDAATSASQLEAFWEDDLQSVVQMGFVQNQEAIFSSQNIQGPVPASQMKIEL